MLLIDAIDHRQQATEIDDALAQLDVVVSAKARRILDVKERVPGPVALHVLKWILAADRRIAGVQLQRDHGWIGPLDEDIVRGRAVDHPEIPGFVVKADSDIAAQRSRSRFIKTICPASIVIETEAIAVREA